jgi:hypothetical protein
MKAWNYRNLLMNGINRRYVNAFDARNFDKALSLLNWWIVIARKPVMFNG